MVSYQANTERKVSPAKASQTSASDHSPAARLQPDMAPTSRAVSEQILSNTNLKNQVVQTQKLFPVMCLLTKLSHGRVPAAKRGFQPQGVPGELVGLANTGVDTSSPRWTQSFSLALLQSDQQGRGECE